MSDIEVTRDEAGDRFVITVDGEQAGLAAYELHEGVIVFTHTEIDDSHEGEGLGGRLVRAALDTARDEGLAVHPRCAFVRSWIDRHDDYRALVPEADRARFDL